MADRGATPERGSVSRDRKILCKFFDATNNVRKGEVFYDSHGREHKSLQDGWKHKDGWKSGMAMGEWHGVTTNAEGRVIGLELEDNYLKGRKSLKTKRSCSCWNQLVVYLGGNDITGGIPKELGKLQALKKLDVSRNYGIGGVIPPELGDLKALEELHLMECDLEGGIPSLLGKLQALKKLSLFGNVSLGGVIPPELGDLKGLEELNLSRCKLEGGIPSWLGKLQALKRLDLEHNRSLGGVIPPELGDLKALQTLYLSNCGLEGCVPPQLGNLRAARKIHLGRNNLTGLWDHTRWASLGQGVQVTPGYCIPNQLRGWLQFLGEVEIRGSLILNDSPWAEPPAAVVNSGMAAVIQYFEFLYCSPSRVRRNEVKIVLVGQEGAGKTR